MRHRRLALLVALFGLTLLLTLPWHHVVHLLASERRSSASTPPTDSMVVASSITPIPGSAHLMVSAYRDHRLGGIIRVISIVQRHQLQNLYCVKCAHANGKTQASSASKGEPNSEAKANFNVNDDIQAVKEYKSNLNANSAGDAKVKANENSHSNRDAKVRANDKSAANATEEANPKSAGNGKPRSTSAGSKSGLFVGCSISQAKVETHSDNFGFPYVTADMFCSSPLGQEVTHVSITTDVSKLHGLSFLPIKNQQTHDSFRYNFTVCISNLFGGYNNVLQFVQTLEVYKLIGVQRVAIYNTSSGAHLQKVLEHYQREGFLEVVPWPIDKFLTPSTGWRYEEHGGDLHYYGQLTTLNECVYRYMYESRYVLLNDIDEIIMPYAFPNLGSMMEALRQQQPDTNVFLVQNHIFPYTQFDESQRFNLSRWRHVPGVNILEHVFREPDRPGVFNPTKLLVDPRAVQQTSVHSTLRHFGQAAVLPFDVCRIVHVRVPLQGRLTR